MRNLESEQSLITIPKRGLRVIAPEYTQKVMELARKHKEEGTRFTDEEKENLWPNTEKARLFLMKQCGTLARRYPKPEEGRKFMENVDYQRREELLEKARHLSTDIVSSWGKISPDKPIAVILFGSVAKGLVKHTQNPDPSNIDIAVIGDISSEERESLMDEIRPHRKSLQEWILQRVPFINSSDKNPGNAGVIIQNIEKLTKDNLEPAKNYITSGAIALYDPEGIWSNIESQALNNTYERIESKKNKRLPKREIVFSRS
jgi:predicted nucleotidyltransferase